MTKSFDRHWPSLTLFTLHHNARTANYEANEDCTIPTTEKSQRHQRRSSHKINDSAYGEHLTDMNDACHLTLSESYGFTAMTFASKTALFRTIHPWSHLRKLSQFPFSDLLVPNATEPFTEVSQWRLGRPSLLTVYNKSPPLCIIGATRINR